MLVIIPGLENLVDVGSYEAESRQSQISPD